MTAVGPAAGAARAAGSGLLVVSGTGTGVGKTVVTAALAALARAVGRTVAVVKPAQTGVEPGEPGDLAEVARLAGLDPSHLREGSRFRAPLAPATAARLEGADGPAMTDMVALVVEAAGTHDTVLVEGAGGLLVRFADDGWTVADLAAALVAPVLVVVDPRLGALNSTALTLEALEVRGLALAGLVIGSWPADDGHPLDLASRANLADLEELARAPLAGVLPVGAGRLDPDRFTTVARRALGPSLGGTFDAADFRRRHDPPVGRARREERR